MSAAGFVLAINLFVAGLFATAFGIVATYYRDAIGARWLSLAYAVGLFNGIFEFILPYQVDARPVSVALYAAFLFALALSNVGICRHYNLKPPFAVLIMMVVVSLGINVAILDMPRDSMVRGLLYQLPYAAMQLYGAKLVLKRKSNRALDVALIALMVLVAVNFVSKPFIALLIGSGGSPQGYLSSSYAAISQSAAAVLLISNGLLLLLIIVRDMMADMTARSETDILSSLLNRRGFEDQADKARLLALRAGAPAVLVVADLDHFKLVNDTYGHAAGDQVIVSFGRVLKSSFDLRAVIGRLGGEEFAILLPGADLTTARGAVETARRRMRDLSPEERGIDRVVTSSFGMAALDPGDSLAEALRRADTALYEAKARGRDRVCVATPTLSAERRPEPEARAS